MINFKMPTSKLYFDPNVFSVVKEEATERWFAVRIADTPFGQWKKLGNVEIDCIPISNGVLVKGASRPILRKELNDAFFFPNAAFEY